MLEDLLERFRRCDRLALARLISLLCRGEGSDELLAKLGPATKPIRVVAVTGNAGVGKSTLLGKLIEYLRRQGQTVAVLACDPQSPLTGGALLGDRFRMPTAPDDGVFIRSLAAAPGQEAVAADLGSIIRLVERFGFDVVLVETAGSGQGETRIRGLVDVLVLLLQPETGDDIQWEKAGVLEVADVLVIHKADLPGAEGAVAQVRAAVELSGRPDVPVLEVSSKSGEGIGALWDAINASPARRPAACHDGRDLLLRAQEELASLFFRKMAAQDPPVQELLAHWRDGSVGRDQALASLFCLLLPRKDTP